jgi:adenine-specific DNA-methyltransferase
MVNDKKNVKELKKQIVQTQAALNAYKQYGLEPEYGIKIIFQGKNDARRVMRRIRPRHLRSISELGIGSQSQRSANQVIEGDNLQAMTSLYRKRGKVDLIIADPPYNTGKDFRYNDKWDEDPK